MRVKITLRCSECKQKLQYFQEQEERSRSSGDEEVLPLLQEAHRSQRNQVMWQCLKERVCIFNG